MRVFGGPKKPRKLFKLNKFGADRHHREYDERKRKLRSVIRYTHMPEILPRIRALGQKLGHFAFMLALVFRSARLLPDGHPMLNPANVGQYGIRDVIATAANNLTMKRENIDQIVIFGAVILSLIMTFIQAALIGFYTFMGSASAGSMESTGGSGMFSTPSPDDDLAFQFMRQVFGVADIFGNKELVIQSGLHSILGFYSTAMMIIAVLIVIYYVVTTVGEAAQSGKPFGRMNTLWAPIRLVLALGLLVPLGGGLNTAQYAVLYIGKLGSGLATQGWAVYTENFVDIKDPQDQLDTTGPIGIAHAPSVQPLVQGVFASEACRAAYNKIYTSTPVRVVARYTSEVSGNVVFAPNFTEDDIQKARDSKATTLQYIWTRDDPSVTSPESTCGSVAFELKLKYKAGSSETLDSMADAIAQKMYGRYVGIMGSTMEALSNSKAGATPDSTVHQFVIKYTNSFDDPGRDEDAIDPNVLAADVAKAVDAAQTNINAFSRQQTVDVSKRSEIIERMQGDAKVRGWTTAGAYYIEIAKINQAITNAIYGAEPAPRSSNWAAIGEDGLRGLWNAGADFLNLGKWEGSEVQKELAGLYLQVPDLFALKSVSVPPADYRGRPRLASIAGESLEGNIAKDPIGWILKNLFGDAFIRLLDRPTLSPMETLIQGGSDILERSLGLTDAYLLSKGIELGSSLIPIFGSLLGGIAAAAGAIIWFLITIGAAVGIILFYVLPMMPFMYFFFSVVNWVVEVAEAFISMPLFALAHLRIDGDGLPGQTAYNGYLTLFGVMMRPLLIILGLIVSSLIFGAASYYLATIYKSAIFAYQIGANGDIDFTKMGGFDIMIYMILYVYIVYILANSTFKLIDKIPDEMMRWVGGSKGFTGDKPVDVGNLQTMALAGYAGLKQAQSTLNSGVASARQGISQTREASAARGGQRGKKTTTGKEGGSAT